MLSFLRNIILVISECVGGGDGERGTKSANISVNSARYKSIGATVMPPLRSRNCQKFSSPRAANYCPIPLRETSVSRTLADGLYFSARASPRCNLYLITAGNILDLKSFLVKYRNIKETSGALPQGEASERAVEGNDLPFMNSLRLPGRLENPRSCSYLSPLFLFHSSPFARSPPSFLPSFRPTTLSISFRSARTFHRRPPLRYSLNFP